MNAIVGKWQQPEGQAYAGLWFAFNEDGHSGLNIPKWELHPVVRMKSGKTLSIWIKISIRWVWLENLKVDLPSRMVLYKWR